MYNLELEEIISDLEKVKYNFCVLGLTIFLDRMVVLRRKTKRHSFTVINEESYSRLNERDFGVKEEPEVSLEVQLLAIAAIRKKISFKRWERV